MLTDQGSVFVSKEWTTSCHSSNIDLRHTGTESHNSLGNGETYHAMLRRIYNKVRLEHPDFSPELVLSLSTKAMNDTAGPNGLVPSSIRHLTEHTANQTTVKVTTGTPYSNEVSKK